VAAEMTVRQMIVSMEEGEWGVETDVKVRKSSVLKALLIQKI
jgi:hypothetical protein